jgi:hypothetical protein
MKKMMTFLISLTLLAGCSRGSNGGGNKTAQVKTVTVNGENPEDYFNRFLYRASGKCQDYSIYFHYLNSEDITLTDSLNGKPMKAEITLFLNKDKSFQVDYEEREVSYYTDSGYAYDVTFRKRISGTWKVNQDGQLVIGDFGTGSALKYNDRPAVMLKPAVDVHQSGLKNQNIVLSMVMSSGSRELFDSVCSSKK